MTVVSVYVIFADIEEARAIGRKVIEERLAACVNILGEVESVYRWRGAIETSNEVAAIFKTGEAVADALMQRIALLHSYEVPCVTSWPIDKVLGSYASFVEDSVT